MQDDERDPADEAAAAEAVTDESTQPVAEEAPSQPAPSEAEAWVVPPPASPSNPDLIAAHPSQVEVTRLRGKA